MTNSPLNPQIIGRTENALRSLLEKILDGTGLDYRTWVALNLAAATGSPESADRIVARLTDALKVDDEAARSALAALVDKGLIKGGSDLALTTAGHATYDRVRAEIGRVTAGLFEDIPAEDLAIAGRVLVEVTERANAAAAA